MLDNVPSEISETLLEGDDLKDLLDNGAAGRVSAGLDRRLPRMFGGIVARVQALKSDLKGRGSCEESQAFRGAEVAPCVAWRSK